MPLNLVRQLSNLHEHSLFLDLPLSSCIALLPSSSIRGLIFPWPPSYIHTLVLCLALQIYWDPWLPGSSPFCWWLVRIMTKICNLSDRILLSGQVKVAPVVYLDCEWFILQNDIKLTPIPWLLKIIPSKPLLSCLFIPERQSKGLTIDKNPSFKWTNSEVYGKDIISRCSSKRLSLSKWENKTI